MFGHQRQHLLFRGSVVVCAIGCGVLIKRADSKPHIRDADCSTAGLGCGPAALVTVACTYGPEVRRKVLHAIEADRAAGRHVSTMYELAGWAEKAGLKPMGLGIGTGNLSQIPVPFIAHLGPDHFVAVLELRDDAVAVNDEAGHFVDMPRVDFERRFSGQVLCFP